MFNRQSNRSKNKSELSVNTWNTPVEYIKGVGPAKADLLKKELGIHTLGDLLEDYPTRYVDRTQITPINHIRTGDGYVQLRGKLIQLEMVGEKKSRRLMGVLKDSSGEIEMIWFQSIKILESILQVGQDYLVFGKVNSFRNILNITHPEMELANTPSPISKGWVPVYRSTAKLDKKYLDSKGRRPLIFEALKMFKDSQPLDPLPVYLREKYKLTDQLSTFYNIHFPRGESHQKQAERRIKYEEFFYLQLDLIRQMTFRKGASKGFVLEKVGDQFSSFFQKHLPFQLTEAQKKVLKEIRQDTRNGKQMNRLLQGDVGSGKTIIGFMTMLLAIDNGYQACLMAPTEILARQHLASLQDFAKNLGLSIELLTGSIKGKSRKVILDRLALGELAILVGTHALIEDTVIFKQLGMVIIDEQHRFGVAQRAKLWAKSKPFLPHVLVMTATPIPRTLHMTLYGDLDVSVIDELPPGRKPIITKRITAYSRPNLYQFISQEIEKGKQVYVVYPLIEESEKLDLASLMEGYDEMSKVFPAPKFKLSIVHGKMPQEQKDSEMERFAKGITQILVATTVIEVGVNVPNASIMVIENSERFGLSQLHQLRGRVGRGSDQSYCFLMAGHKVSKEASFKMNTMVETNDGFKIAEADLSLRGPGTIDGTQQSGIIELKLASISEDGNILTAARNDAKSIIAEDPNFLQPQYSGLKEILIKKYGKGKIWAKIS
jgi:ATP-dependent DNA helicase RecG